MNWPEKVKIVGHSSTHYLEKITDGSYICKDSYYTRFIGNPENLKAIDYEGGPMLYIGFKIEELGTIESISTTGIIHFIRDVENVN